MSEPTQDGDGTWHVDNLKFATRVQAESYISAKPKRRVRRGNAWWRLLGVLIAVAAWAWSTSRVGGGGVAFWASALGMTVLGAVVVFVAVWYFFPGKDTVFAVDWSIAAGVLVAVWLAWWWVASEDSRAISAKESAEQKAKMEALSLCQKTIGAVASYGSGNTPGHTSGRKIKDMWQFLWPHGSFQFKNGFGVDIPQSARCEVNVLTGRIVYLSVSGATIIQ